MILRDRAPSAAGTFYESTSESLRKRLEWCFLHKLGPGSLPSKPIKAQRSILGLVSPHAGFIYSGPIAAHGYLQISTEPAPKVVAILGPNHTGMGAGVSIWDGGDWETPLGKVPVEMHLARSIADTGAGELDGEAHLFEHSIEVQLPFLQYSLGEGFKIIPICMMLQDKDTSAELGSALARALKPTEALIIASTDFSHYEPYSVAYTKDSKVAEAILKMNPAGVGTTVEREGISMCGPGPVMAAMTAAKAMGATISEKLCYATSGDTSGSKGEVVGYGSFTMTR
jgi:AmmeMemoRadiSam system protein B